MQLLCTDERDRGPRQGLHVTDLCASAIPSSSPTLGPHAEADSSRARCAGAAKNQVFLLPHERDELRSRDV